MSINAREFKVLAEKICSEVLATIPFRFETHEEKKSLDGKIEAILADHQQADSIPITRHVTILLSDIRGFTALAETYSAITVMNMLNRYFTCMTDVIVRNGGTIDKLMGDSIMALFGAPSSSSDDVQRAVCCAVEMQRSMSEFNEQNIALGLPEIYMGIGINTGQVIAGALGSDHHREYTVIGDEVNLASRIEAQSLRGQVLISENTYQLAKQFVLVGEPNCVQVKGKKRPVCLYELLSTSKPRSVTVPRREIRKSPRVVVNIPCYFQLVEGKLVKSDTLEGEVLDISYNGLLMQSPMPLTSFSEIKIEVSLQLLGSETTSVYARVINTDNLGKGVICSLEFTSMDVAAQNSIKRFVDSQISTSAL